MKEMQLESFPLQMDRAKWYTFRTPVVYFVNA